MCFSTFLIHNLPIIEYLNNKINPVRCGTDIDCVWNKYNLLEWLKLQDLHYRQGITWLIRTTPFVISDCLNYKIFYITCC